MNVDSDGDKGLREVNHRVYVGNKRTTNCVVPEEHVMLEEDDLKVNKIAQNVKYGHVGAFQAPAMRQMAQQQPQNAMCYWQRFLHLTTVTVLLVENDDSTRHVVTALLRNCCYDVIEAANVLQAWKILEDLTNHIDLILAEVGIPSLSGLVLLSKIMSHKTRKNVPVIMMSSQDSMNLVFKCLSKGAVDFLVKPVRKNELKNLWQHVWRRCHSSSGSGSESGTQTQKSVGSKSVEKSDNNSGSNDEDNNGSGGLNVVDGSDIGSGTQNSWTKQAVEVDSPHLVSPSDKVAECPDSTCAQVVHSNAEVSGNKGVPVAAARGFQERDEQLDNVAMGKELGVNKPRDLNLLLQCPVEAPIRTVETKQINLLEMSSSKYNEQIDKRQLDLNSEAPSGKEKSEAANQAGITSMTTDPKMEIAECEASYRLSKISDGNDKTINDSKELPSIELGLKRLRGVKDAGTEVRDERNVLRRSDSSAFSRYNNAANANKVPAVNTGSSSAVDNHLELTRKGSLFDNRSHFVNDLNNQSSNVGSNNIGMGSTTNNASAKAAAEKNKSAISSTVRSSHPSAVFQPMINDLLSTSQKVVLDEDDNVTTTGGPAQPRGTHQELKMQHPSNHHDQHRHLTNDMQQQQPPEHDDLSLKTLAADAPHCGSSNMLGGLVEGNASNYSINGSASGSNHGSNGTNGSSNAVNTVGKNMESDNGIAGKSGSGDVSGSGSGSKADQSKSAHREATLTKFRQKRKERCFQKRVRYQSRKRLAEQRPRINGQFVQQTPKNTDLSSDGNSCDE
ncbi:Two-component response regulator-like APRR7 [Hibiscus syriacus]|uniref:Two-component response regulator-like APRR7 n=1 Tax=Hibiscus syriacus TaxID=106335 RepID=A0A6A2ZDU7_HIBSY|nr:two-component response regulator-like APRR7 [Hibiscus syriacus]XP_039016142.1 two-component response regulator-like APRR7 [Hibiscus syriacus]XP_039016143.1 two-component response regulator-like APRR7 [Hibiscus syriacus]KAE8689756.1 Two-component response regulator-like APRR7 [Hibiscus syriacus]